MDSAQYHFSSPVYMDTAQYNLSWSMYITYGAPEKEAPIHCRLSGVIWGS